jgi:hypothetical protein
MNDFAQQLDAAEKAGYNPTQIVDHLKGTETYKSQIDQALREGYTHEQIYQEMYKQASMRKVSVPKWVGKQVVGATETTLALTSAAATYIPTKIVGSIAALAGQDPRLAEQWFQTEFLPVYQPRTKRGQEATALAFKPFEALLYPARKTGEVLEKAGVSKQTAYTAETGVEGVIFAALSALGIPVTRKIKGTVKARIAAEVVKQPELVKKPIAAKAPLTEGPKPKLRYTAEGELKPTQKYAQSVNLEKQLISDKGKVAEVLVAGNKKTQGWAKTEQLAKNVDRAVLLDKAKKGEGLSTAEHAAMRKINVNSAEVMGKIVDTAKTDVELNSALAQYKDNVFSLASDAASEAGRSLNYYKKVIGPDAAAKALSKLDKNLKPHQMKRFKEMVKGGFEPHQVKRFITELKDPKLRDYVMEYWYNSILSGIPTHMVNIASNTSWLAYQVPHAANVAIMDKFISTLTGKARTRYLNEAVPMMAGYKSGFKRGTKSAKEMVKAGEIAEFETKWAQEIGQSAVGAWARSPSPIIRKLAPYISAPTRALRAMDVWANSIAYDAAINRIARRQSNKKGLKGQARTKFEVEFKEKLPDWAHEESMKYAKHNTFMDDPDPFTAWFLKLRKVPVIGPGSQFVVPFVNTIGNLTKRGLEFTPGVGFGKEWVSRKMGRGLGTPEIVAKQIEGAILTAYIWHKLEKGEITGEAPKTKSQREALYRRGQKPWAIKHGDTWIQYRRMEPYNTAIASAAIAYDKFQNAKDDKTRTEIFGEAARALTNNVLDSSYLQGLQGLFDKHGAFKTQAPRFFASFVPYSGFWRSINRAYEKATEGEAKVRKKDNLVSAFSQVIPGLSGKIPAEIDVWGEEKVIPGSILQHWLPYKWSKENPDKAEKELARLDIYPGHPKKNVTINRREVTLDDDIYKGYAVLYGRNAKQAISYIIGSRDTLPKPLLPLGPKLASFRKVYSKVTDDTKRRMLDNVLTTIRSAALRRAKMQQVKR